MGRGGCTVEVTVVQSHLHYFKTSEIPFKSHCLCLSGVYARGSKRSHIGGGGGGGGGEV